MGNVVSSILVVLFKLIRMILGLFGWVVSAIAVLFSWHFNESVLWAILHFIFGAFYLIYLLAIGSFSDGAFLDIINLYL